jgi:hypothetical protein
MVGCPALLSGVVVAPTTPPHGRQLGQGRHGPHLLFAVSGSCWKGRSALGSLDHSPAGPPADTAAMLPPASPAVSQQRDDARSVQRHLAVMRAGMVRDPANEAGLSSLNRWDRRRPA